MSRKLLEHLNGEQRGALHQWLQHHPGEPRIAWYPSANRDYRDVLYLHPDYRRLSQPLVEEPPAPDIFIHTDYHARFEVPGSCDSVLPLASDGMTGRWVAHQEELPRLHLPFHPELVAFPASADYGRALFLSLAFESNRLGTFERPLIYVCAENAAFCEKVLLANDACISHIVQVRYGHGIGGGRSGPAWLLNVLERLHCQVFISDGSHKSDALNDQVFKFFPALEEQPKFSLEQATKIREMRQESWEGYGPVTWFGLPSP